MMKWHIDQIVSISALSRRFGGVEDDDLLILLDRIKLIDEAYKYIEKCCKSVTNFTQLFTDSNTTIVSCLSKLLEANEDCLQPKLFKAHMEYMSNEYGKWVKSKLDLEITELLLSQVNEKRQTIDDLKKRINMCNKSCVLYKEMQHRSAQLRKEGENDLNFKEEYEKQKIVVDQQKLQLQSDVHFIVDMEIPILEHNFDIILGLMQRSVSHNNALLIKDPPNYLLNPDAPFVEGKEDSEIDFMVSAGGSHFLPLSIKKGRELIWSVTTDGNDIGFRLLYSDEKMNKTIIEPMHRICVSGIAYQGSYIGIGSGMLELLFDNSHAYFRSKKIHVRLAVIDEPLPSVEETE